MILKKKLSGFTLVELIIALSILSIVMVLCASGFKFGTRVWERVNIQSEHIETLQTTHSFLRNSISRALIKERSFDDMQLDSSKESRETSTFYGDSKQINYVSGSIKHGDNYYYSYHLSYDRYEGSLILTYYPYINKAIKDSVIESSMIVNDVRDMEIQYFSGYIDEESGDNWLSSWDDIYTLPLLVKINLTFIDSDKQWPELIIPLRNGPYIVR